MWMFLLRGAAAVGGRAAIPAAGEVVATQGGRVIATEAAKGMATIVLAKEVATDITQQQRCNKCEPYQLGNKHEIERSMGNEINSQYQFKIANLSSYPLTFRTSPPVLKPGNTKPTTRVQEWVLSGVSFDGLWPMECILVEAKGRYAQFLQGKPDFLKRTVFDKMRNEAVSQKTVKDSFKTAKLSWYFYEQETKTHFDRFTRNIVPTIFMPL